MKYKVGDKVRVKTDLVVDKTYGGVCFVKNMAHWRGHIVTISRIGDYFYKIEENLYPFDYNWTDEMFEDVVETKRYKVGDKVKVREDLIDCETYDEINYVSDMDEWKGKIVTISYANDNYYEIAEDNQTDKWMWSAEMFEDVSDDNVGEIKARTVDVGYYLNTYGHRVIKNVYQGVDNGKLFFTTVDGLNQYVIPKDAVEWIIPHPQEIYV